MTRLLHFSDLHFGPPLHPGAPARLKAEVERHRPDLVVVSGDFTQRAKPRQFRAAAAFLDSLGVPVFAVPGNHDIPLYPVHRRGFTPYRQYRRWICRELEPVLEMEDVVLVGLNTTAPYLVVEGHAGLGRLRRWRQRLEELPSDRVRVVVAHHPLLPTPDGDRRHVLHGARRLVSMLAEEGVQLVLGGHFHLSFLRDAGEVSPGADGLLVCQSGTSASNRGRGEDAGTRSFAVVEIDGGDVVVERWKSTGDAPFESQERRRASAPRGGGSEEVCPICGHRFSVAGFRRHDAPGRGASTDTAYVRCPSCRFKFEKNAAPAEVTP